MQLYSMLFPPLNMLFCLFESGRDIFAIIICFKLFLIQYYARLLTFLDVQLSIYISDTMNSTNYWSASYVVADAAGLNTEGWVGRQKDENILNKYVTKTKFDKFPLRALSFSFNNLP